jgi:AraC-like DNA-binding protein
VARGNRLEYEKRVNRVIDHIREHLAEDLSLAGLARVAAFSPFHFDRVFKAITGETLFGFVQRLRIERAAGALRLHPDQSVLAVALDHGFASAATFARAFRAHFGMSATQWRAGGAERWRRRRKPGKAGRARRRDTPRRRREEESMSIDVCSGSIRRRSPRGVTRCSARKPTPRACGGRAQAGGRWKKTPEILPRLRELLKRETAGDPMTELKWTRKTTANAGGGAEPAYPSLGMGRAARARYPEAWDHLEAFLDAVAEAGDGAGLPQFVEREFREFLLCGVFEGGVARFQCEGCAREHLVPFSCKGRAWCPSCGGRRMTERAAHLVDAVLPWVPVRQWVLTVPYRLRYQMAWNHGLSRAVLRVYTRVLLDVYARASPCRSARAGR